jgi:hypothetical protein
MIARLKSLLPMPKRDSLVKWGLTVTTSIIMVSMGLCLYWVVVDRKLPIEVHRGEVILYQKQMDDSWVFVVRWTGTLRRRCGGISNRWIVDGFRLPLTDIPYPAEPEPAQLNKVFTWEVPVHVPAYFVSTGHDSGQYRARFLYACNPLQERIFPIADTPPAVSFKLPIESQPETSPGQNLIRPQ